MPRFLLRILAISVLFIWLFSIVGAVLTAFDQEENDEIIYNEEVILPEPTTEPTEEIIVEGSVSKDVLPELDFQLPSRGECIPQPLFDISEEDKLLIAKLLVFEAGTYITEFNEDNIENFDEKCAVVIVVLNRYYIGRYGKTFREIIYANDGRGNYQFVPAKLLMPQAEWNNSWNTTRKLQLEEALFIVNYVCMNGRILPESNMYFPKYICYFKAHIFHKFAIDFGKFGSTCFSFTEEDFNRIWKLENLEQMI